MTLFLKSNSNMNVGTNVCCWYIMQMPNLMYIAKSNLLNSVSNDKSLPLVLIGLVYGVQRNFQQYSVILWWSVLFVGETGVP